MTSSGLGSAAEIVAAGQRNLISWPMTSSDGVEVTAWSNQGAAQAGPDAVDVVVCAGLGTPPEAWPTLLAQPERYRVVGTYWRGTQGAPRPAGPVPTVNDHVRDAIAVMDQVGMPSAVFLGWSFGVNIAFQAAVSHPHRVGAVLGVAGVPGDTFEAMFGPLPVPHRIRKPLAVLTSRVLSLAGPAVTLTASTLPIPVTAWVFRHSHFTEPTGSADFQEAVLRVLLTHDFAWYFALARSSAAHPRLDLRELAQPSTLIAGSHDVLTSARQMAERAAEIAGCRFVELTASHFLLVEFPQVCEQELDALVGRIRRN